jgi:hypothetical protein
LRLRLRGHQPRDQHPGHLAADLAGALAAARLEPLHRPVDRAQDRQRRDLGVDRPEDAGGDPLLEDLAEGVLVFVAPLLHLPPPGLAQGLDLEVGERARRPLLGVVQQHHVPFDQQAQLLIRRDGQPAHPRREGQEAPQRILLDEGEQLLLVLEVVIEVAHRHPQFRRDIAHAGGLEAAPAEDPRRRVEDLALLVEHLVRGSPRDLNHRSKSLHSGASLSRDGGIW